jgi:hypothetical protein
MRAAGPDRIDQAPARSARFRAVVRQGVGARITTGMLRAGRTDQLVIGPT